MSLLSLQPKCFLVLVVVSILMTATAPPLKDLKYYLRFMLESVPE
jgi:hypothetical protein